MATHPHPTPSRPPLSDRIDSSKERGLGTTRPSNDSLTLTNSILTQPITTPRAYRRLSAEEEADIEIRAARIAAKIMARAPKPNLSLPYQSPDWDAAFAELDRENEHETERQRDDI